MPAVETYMEPSATGDEPLTPTQSLTTVFLYGTLMTGEALHSIMKGAILIGKGITQPGFALVDLGVFPGLIEYEGTLKVQGELYYISSQRLITLDDLESEGWLYLRRPLTIKGPTEDMKAMVYMLHPQLAKEYRQEGVNRGLVSSPNIEGVADDTIRWRRAKAGVHTSGHHQGPVEVR